VDNMATEGGHAEGVEWVTLAEGAQRVGKSTKTLRRAIKGGRLNAQRSGGGESGPWLVSSQSLAQVYGEVTETAVEVTAALSAQLSEALAMVNDANKTAMEAVERAARAETERDHLKERLAETRADLEAAQSTPEPKRRWWNR